MSVPSNIAEGFGRNNNGDFIRFLSIAMGSKAELETQLLLCVRLNYLTDSDIESAMGLCTEIGKMISAMLRKLRSEH